MTKTVVIHDVPASELSQVIEDLKSEGYNTSYYLEPDSEFTVVGTKEVNKASDAKAKPPLKAKSV